MFPSPATASRSRPSRVEALRLLEGVSDDVLIGVR
jgi:hypothetical protein